MIEFYIHLDIPKDFTGICKILKNNEIRYYKDGLLHNTIGPAIINIVQDENYYINGKLHRENGPAIDCKSGYKEWFYKNRYYGKNNSFTNKTWKKKVKELKYLESLEIFK